MEKELQRTSSFKILDYDEERGESDPNFDHKLDTVTTGGSQYLEEHLLTKITRNNCKTIVDYVLAMQIEIGPSQTYRIDTINKLKYFAEFHNLIVLQRDTGERSHKTDCLLIPGHTVLN